MDSSSSSITSAGEATEALKSLLKVGKPPVSQSPADTPTASLQEDIQKLLGMHSSTGGDETGASQMSNISNGEFLIQDILKNMSQQQAITQQQILLQGSDQQNSFSVYGREVDIIASKISGSGTPSPGSNKVQINPVVNFDWEHKMYTGNLVAVHRNCIHVAYVLRGKSGGVVRVINRKTAQRSLLKGFTGKVVDIAFAHLTSIIIGAVDEVGNMFVYEINEDTEGKIDTTLVLQVMRPNGTQLSDYHRVVWCPFIPEEEEASTATMTTNDSTLDDASRLLVLTHGSIAEMWNVDVVTKENGPGPMLPEDVEEGYVVIDNHEQPIFDASFSPDGTALATASLDGEVKFFQVNLHEQCPPKCLYEWKPHKGKPVTSLFFLDDHKNPNPDVQFWKFAITGADNNREIKIWSCESWTCLQSLYFRPQPDVPSNFMVEPCLKVRMDLSANYLVLSDINRKVLYVMSIFQDREASRAHISSVSEFLLTQPCVSLAILNVGVKTFKKSDLGNGLHDITTEVDDEDDLHREPQISEEKEKAVLLKLFTVHTKVLQELSIRFKPESSTPQPPPASLSSVSHDEACRDLMSDISMDTVASESSGQVSLHSHSFDGQGHLAGRPPAQPMLMTPEAFTSTYSPRKDTKEAPTPMDSARSSATVQSNISGMSSLTQVTGMDEDALRSARGSLMNSQNVSSPQSSVTLTPASSKDLSIGSHMETPTSVPLPPPTPGEEGALASPPLRQPPPPSQLPQPPIPEVSGTPPHSSRSLEHLTAGVKSHDFLTSSPATRFARDEFKPPHTSQSQSDIEEHSESLPHATPRAVDDFFTHSDVHRPKLGSAESSSSTSLEVREILEGGKKTEPCISGDMEEEEEENEENRDDADEEQEEEEESEENDQDAADENDLQPTSSIEAKVHTASSQETPSEEEEIEEVIEAEEEESGASTNRSSNMFSSGAWPKPPEPPEMTEINLEAQRLSSEALHRATTFTLEPQGMYEDPERTAVKEVDLNHERQEVDLHAKTDLHRTSTYTIESHGSLGGMYEDQADDDVQVEEEQDEIVDGQNIGRSLESDSYSGRDNTKDTSDDRQIPHKTESSGEPAYHSPRIDTMKIEQLQGSVQQMLSLLQTQQREIEHLRTELNQQRGAEEKLEGLQSQIDSLEGLLTSKVSETLTQHSVTETERLHQVLGQRETHEKQKHDALISQLTQTLDRTITHKLERVVKDEIRNHVVPKIEEIIEPVKNQLHKEMAQKLTATDQLVKDNIAKLIRSRQTVEAMGTAAGNALQGPVQSACKDVLIPSFDRACQNMFQQVNTAFLRGTQDYIKQLDGHLEQVRQRHDESRDPIIRQLQSMVDGFHSREQANEPLYTQLHNLAGTMQSHLEQSQHNEARMEKQMKQAIAGVQDTVVSEMKKLIHDEVVVAMRDQQSSLSTQLLDAMRSGMMTPVPPLTPDPEQQKTQVLQMLRQGQLNAAFQQALSASDLNLVLFVCETVNPSQVFNQIPCPLQQPVLLSLIQQLSADLGSHIELKHHYLQEAVMNLDQSNPITKEHMPAVLSQLCQKLLSHIQAHPQDRSTRNLKMLLMASQSLLK